MHAYANEEPDKRAKARLKAPLVRWNDGSVELRAGARCEADVGERRGYDRSRSRASRALPSEAGFAGDPGARTSAFVAKRASRWSCGLPGTHPWTHPKRASPIEDVPNSPRTLLTGVISGDYRAVNTRFSVVCSRVRSGLT
jgi:hypothetical protein